MELVITKAVVAQANSSTVLAANRLAWVAFTWVDGAAPRTWIAAGLNGALLETSYATQTTGSGAPTSEAGGALEWGNRTGSSVAHLGDLIVGAHFDRELSLVELRDVTRGYLPRGCTHAFTFGENAGGRVYDETGNGLHGTITGATVRDNMQHGIAPGRFWRITRAREGLAT